MRDLAAGDRSNRQCLDRHNRSGLSVEGRELDFESLPIRVDVDDRAAHADRFAGCGVKSFQRLV